LVNLFEMYDNARTSKIWNLLNTHQGDISVATFRNQIWY